MEGYQPAMSFGVETAETYDDDNRGGEAATVDFLASLAADGPALELAIGTGRIAIPLAQRGVRVDGIDISPAMVARLRAKPGGAELAVTLGDYADVAVEGNYRLIYVVYNTLFNLLTQEDQVRCFENVAAHLTDDGRFVVEAYTPMHLMDIREEQYVMAEGLSLDEVRLDVARHDRVAQLLYESHVTLSREGTRVNPIITRYAWPSELDLMARIAGLARKERWAGWNREPVTGDSRNLVSVYGR